MSISSFNFGSLGMYGLQYAASAPLGLTMVVTTMVGISFIEVVWVSIVENAGG